MPKISATNSKTLLIRYLISVIISSAGSILLLSAVSSFIFLKLDISLSLVKYISIAIVAISSVIIALVSMTGFKNNFLLVSAIAEVPLALYVFINMLVNETNSTICIIKLVVIFLCAVAVSLLKSARKR